MTENELFMAIIAILWVHRQEHNDSPGDEGNPMKITQLRNATVVLEIGAYRILVDPMLAEQGALPPLRVLNHRQRNPTVGLPALADSVLRSVTHCLITHCQKGHFDHLDRAGIAWLRSKRIPVVCTQHDAGYLRERGLNVHPLPENHQEPCTFLSGRIRAVPCTHGRGLVGLFMEHGVGYFVEMPGEPSLYLAGDTILTPTILDFVQRHRPDISLIPAGGARLDVGQEIIMGTDEVVAFALASHGTVVANHLEALSHCPVKRDELSAAAAHAGVHDRLRIPEDGEALVFSA